MIRYEPRGSVEAPKLRVIEWPQAGAAARFPMGGWWVVEDRGPSRGFSPLDGPFQTQGEADGALEHRKEQA